MENNKTRISYSKDFKKKILIALSKNQDIRPLFFEHNINLTELLQKDKKYLSKLLNKWKQELCINRELIFLQNQKLTNETIDKELMVFENNETNIIEKHYKTKYKEILKSFKEKQIENKGLDYTQY